MINRTNRALFVTAMLLAIAGFQPTALKQIFSAHASELTSTQSNMLLVDTDNDGIDDSTDLDDDDDGILDTDEGYVATVGPVTDIARNGVFNGPSNTTTTTIAEWTFAGNGSLYSTGASFQFYEDESSQTMTQNALTGLATGPGSFGAAQIEISFSARNATPVDTVGNSATFEILVGGVVYAQVVTSDSESTDSAVSYLNGASGTYNGSPTDTPSVVAADTTSFGTMLIDLPGNVSDNGDVVLSYDAPSALSDDFEIDNIEIFTNTLTVTTTDNDADGVADHLDSDSDNDGIPDGEESTFDTDNDGIPNYLDLDSDNDGLTDALEAGGDDADGNGVLDDFVDVNGDGQDDGVAAVPYANADTDDDGIVDSLDTDSDNDGLTDLFESTGLRFDSDGDGRLDIFVDANGDGLADDADINTFLDSDGDGNPNYLALDSDGDGLFDIVEAGGIDLDSDGRMDGWMDRDGDGINDTVDFDVVGGRDADNDGLSDFADVDYVQRDDSDGDGIIDNYDLDPFARGYMPVSNADQPVVLSALPDIDGDNVPDILEANPEPTIIEFIPSLGAANPDGQVRTSLGRSGCSITTLAKPIDPILLLMILCSVGVLMSRRRRRENLLH